MPARSAPSDFLLVIGERAGLRWILENDCMAFPDGPYRLPPLAAGDRLWLYTTRGCFHNPTRDRGRVIGVAEVRAAVHPFGEPVEIAGRTYRLACPIRIDELAPLDRGVELAPLVPLLEVFAGGGAWAIKLRRTLVRLSAADAQVLRTKLKPVAVRAGESRDDYLARARIGSGEPG